MMKSTHLMFVAAHWVLLSFTGFIAPAAAQQFAGNDLRDIRIGMAVGDLPASGYVKFACANEQGHAIAAWSDWSKCPPGDDGLHAIKFDYDPATSREGTIVAGHPALLTLLVDDKGVVAGLRIETDPKARLYIRKKAFLFGIQVKSRYGADGWTCQEAQPENGEQSVGGVYINESCRKTIQGRSITVERALYRRADQDTKSFVDKTSVLIQRSQG
jgi:hypothetical protein